MTQLKIRLWTRWKTRGLHTMLDAILLILWFSLSEVALMQINDRIFIFIFTSSNAPRLRVWLSWTYTWIFWLNRRFSFSRRVLGKRNQLTLTGVRALAVDSKEFDSRPTHSGCGNVPVSCCNSKLDQN